MSPELTFLTYDGILVILTILVQVLVAAQQVGLPALAGNREGLVLTGMALRLERATANSLFALALIAPAVIMLHLSKQGSEMVGQALLIFLLARVAYVLLYAFGVAWFRTIAWLIGFCCTAVLYARVLGF
jgi:uncharacterized MAPEG superfamily protein